ncbi:MAG: ATP-binding cassette domain-containing protein [Bacteriovoracia bacterium]
MLSRSKFSDNLSSQHLFLLENISVSYTDKKQPVLQGLHLSIGLGEIVFVSGVSGSGKSTFLNLLAGDLKKYQGRLIVSNGLKSRVTRVYQELLLLEELTARQNLDLVYDSRIHNSKKEFEQEFLELCSILNVSHNLNFKIRNLSSGIRQKFAIIRALLLKPKAILADDPSSRLDQESADKVYELFAFYNRKRDMTVIWTSSNQELIKRYPGRLLHLDKGRMVYSGHSCFI